jgi:hypothetical protein
MDAELTLHCPVCAQVRPIEAPPCADGHGSDCPDRACAICGTALVVASHAPSAGRSRVAARRAA